MADITIKCAQCGREITISEHVSVSMLPCSKCGGLVPVPGRQSTSSNLRLKTEIVPLPGVTQGPGQNAAPEVVAQPAEGLRMKTRQEHAPAATAIIQPGQDAARGGVSPAQVKSRTARDRMARERRRQKLTTLTLIGSWALFLLMGGGMAYFRFVYGPANIQPSLFADIRQYAVWAIMISYVITTLMAFKDNIFNGLLSVAIPMYPFYYLFMNSAAVYFRAVVAGLLAGFGYDFCVFMNKMALSVFDFINHWIQTV